MLSPLTTTSSFELVSIGLDGNRRCYKTPSSAFADRPCLTTKGRDFTAELLEAFQLRPIRLDGRESGPKPEVLLRLRREWVLKGFVEDRRATLEAVLETPGLEGLKCFLADWGYLRPADREGLPEGLDLLSSSKFAAPLAIWL